MEIIGPIYLYVDGESHYIGTEHTFKKYRGEEATLDFVKENPNAGRFPDPSTGPRFSHHGNAKFFWDKKVVTTLADDTRFPDHISRAVYFTAFRGPSDDRQKAMVTIREAGFEPRVIEERGDLADRRAHSLTQNSWLIKPKGVDIELSVRMLEDAYHGNYQTCFLFTSDIDYLPVIEAVRRMGKNVFVFGFQDAIGKNSPFLYVPERFINIGGNYIKSHYLLGTKSI